MSIQFEEVKYEGADTIFFVVHLDFVAHKQKLRMTMVYNINPCFT